MDVFFQGLLIGVAYVAPIGMQNMFVINSALTRTRKMAYVSALIVVFFDVTLALACFLGVGALIEAWPVVKAVVLLIGSLLVIYIGITLLRDKGDAASDVNVNVPLRKVISTACIVTWLNPQALIDGTMLLGAFRASLPASQSWHFITGVMTASFLWFMGLAIILHIFRHKFNAKVIRWINIICGLVIVGYGVKLLVNFIMLVIAL
jgi:L-lysine exporter family protein LysE/ArgO